MSAFLDAHPAAVLTVAAVVVIGSFVSVAWLSVVDRRRPAAPRPSRRFRSF